MDNKKEINMSLEKLKSPKKEVALEAIKSIGTTGEQALPVLTNVINTSDDEELITMSIIVLGEIGEKASCAITDLIEMLGHTNEQIRMAAALSLVRIGKRSIPLLKGKILTNNNKNLLFWTSWVLGMIDPKEVEKNSVSILLNHESNTESMIEKAAAQEVLAKLIGRELDK
ncbi:HEAT repeat domain-containing protein [Massilibacterium senegalense]|uniref:HEAT repeat domain-containing protein n=1 Tax=Massilibacterium senegalense TaxID=1632858 RepID=UPI000782C0BE|nr:HEAT repeat domain-containing protein [Massilibacterium senegalense]